MSLRALVWAVENADCSNSKAKLVLIALANFANDEDCAYPSMATIRRITKQDVKTIRAGLTSLEAERFIVDTGNRKGQSQMVKVWRLLCPTLPETVELKGSAKKKASKSSELPASEMATLPEAEGLPSNPTGSGGVTLPDPVGEPVIEPIPPTPPVCAPRGYTPDSKISEDWQAPAESDLPLEALAVIAHWPADGYADQARRFHDYWLTAPLHKAKRSDWHRMWLGWIRRAGTDIPDPINAPAPLVRRANPKPRPPVSEQSSEGERERAFRAAVIERNGKAPDWLERAGLHFSDFGESEVGLTIYFSLADRSLIEPVVPRIEAHAGEVLGCRCRWVSLRQGSPVLDPDAVVNLVR